MNEKLYGLTMVTSQEDVTVFQYTVFENTYFTFFQISEKRDFLRFFEMTYQKVVSKSLVVNASK